jgi:Mce-associated membrane protein
MTSQNRRPSTSRTPTARPRRVAGSQTALLPVVEVESSGFETGAERPPQPAVAEERAGIASLFDSRRVTTVLVTLVAVLALAAGGLFAWDALSGGDAAAQPSSQPVVISGDDATAGVDAAAKAAEKILTRSYQDYDKQVDEATALMTPAFAKQFRETAGDVEQQFVKDKTDQQARVVAQGVVHATRTEVQALVFLNYYVSKDGGDTTYTAYRALVTVVHTDRGWLVSGIDTK